MSVLLGSLIGIAAASALIWRVERNRGGKG